MVEFRQQFPMKTDSYNPFRGVPPKEDATVESFASYRDNLHKNFRFNRVTIIRLLVLGIIVPGFFWTSIQHSMEKHWTRTLEHKPPQMINIFGWLGPSRRPREYKKVED